ncbi:DJ-1 family glyoxalase III [Anaerococcus prevotii]|uniref:DJ-1 family protein n=1 Tax=Anaerococcus prevotii ACS-065-V-Col13 TaxID=879305 RepID=F0GVG5_9FIRM|nr:DJ-1 family glyoxalase III [Anaerococcus prevotii]EGC82195.1 DJ-1 family protein [Anaerococcus prevotii ACS-065-V-Col13]
MKKFLVLVANGNETIEVLTVVDYLRRADIKVDIASTEEGLDLVTSHDVAYKADIMFDDIKEEDYFGLYIPGGTKGAYSLRDNENVLDLVKRFNDEGKIIAAICAGPVVLNEAGVLFDKKATSFPSMKGEMDKTKTYVDDEIIVTDKNITTSRGAALTNYLALKLIEIIKDKDTAKDIKHQTKHEAVEKYFGFEF